MLPMLPMLLLLPLLLLLMLSTVTSLVGDARPAVGVRYAAADGGTLGLPVDPNEDGETLATGAMAPAGGSRNGVVVGPEEISSGGAARASMGCLGVGSYAISREEVEASAAPDGILEMVPFGCGDGIDIVGSHEISSEVVGDGPLEGVADRSHEISCDGMAEALSTDDGPM